MMVQPPKKMIYMDHASTTYVLPEVIDTIKRTMENVWGNPSNMYAFGEKSHKELDRVRKSLATCIGANPSEIFFTSGASEGNAWIMKQARRVLISPYEHHNMISNPQCTIVDEHFINSCIEAYSQEENKVWKKELSKFIWSHMYVNNETGEIFDIKRLADKAHNLGIKFHSDMTQALGNIPVNVKALGVDYATFTGHKVHAPKGVGFVYINSDSIKYVEPLIYGGKQESGIRAGTENIPYIVGLGQAVRAACNNRVFKRDICAKLKTRMIEELKKYDLDFIVASPENSVPNVLNVCFKNISSENLMMDLSDRGIYCGTGSGCDSGNGDPSYVLKEMKVPEEYIFGPIRFSFDVSNTIDEVVEVAKNIAELVKGYNALVGTEGE